MMGALAARNNHRVKNARQPVNSTIKQQHKNTQTAVLDKDFRPWEKP